MTSENSCSADEFMNSLDKSLTTEYSSHTLPNYVSDLMNAVNNINHIESGFFFYDFSDNYSSQQLSPSLFSCDKNSTQHISLEGSEKRNESDCDDMFKGFESEEILDAGSEINCAQRTHSGQMKNVEQISSEQSAGRAILLKHTQEDTLANDSSLHNVDESIADESTHCEAYEILKSFTNQEQRSIILHKDGAGNDIDDDDDDCDDGTTYCEAYENWNSSRLASQVEAINFSLEEAYAECFLEIQHEQAHSSPVSDRKKILIEDIEKLTLEIINTLRSGNKLSIVVPNKVSWANCIFENERLRLKPVKYGTSYTIRNKRRLAILMFVLSIIYKMLLSNGTCTKREIYYHDPEFTQNQHTVDIAIRDICIILDSRPWELGILSSSKGLIAGSIKITLHDDQIIDIDKITGGILLPQATTKIKKVETSAAFVLLVEKDTVYEKLLSQNVLSRLGKSCILVTGKGYPDINTRVILKRIWEDCKCPIYALVDPDPYGIEIMLTYRYGSLSMSFSADELTVPSIQWMGVYPSEIKSLGLPHMPLTGEDVRKINDMIKRPYISKKIYEELLVLKTTMRKTEVEALTLGSFDLIDEYLLKKIESGIFI